MMHSLRTRLQQHCLGCSAQAEGLGLREASSSSWLAAALMPATQTVLLGDAGRCISPVLGQGCNAGLEDAAVFAQVQPLAAGGPGLRAAVWPAQEGFPTAEAPAQHAGGRQR